MPTSKIRYILDPSITCSENVKQHLLSKSGFFFQITAQICLEYFFIFVSKVNIQHFYLQDNILIITITIIIAYHPHKHNTHASTPSTQTCYPCHPRKHATNPITWLTLAQIARHFSNSISNNFEEQISFEYCRQRVHEYLKIVSACKKLSTVSVRVHYSRDFCEHLIPVPTFAKEVSHKSTPLKGLFH